MSSSRPRILIYDPDRPHRQLLREYLSESFTVIGETSFPEGVLGLVTDLQPDLVLYDVGPDLGLLPSARMLGKVAKDLPLVLMTTKPDTESLKEAMRAGARDLLPKPCPRDALNQSLNRILDVGKRGGQQRSAFEDQDYQGIWSFVRATGGVGQTTLLLSFASHLVQRGKRVLVVDLNLFFGHVAFYLGNPNPATTWKELLESENPLDEDTLRSHCLQHPCGISYLVPPSRPLDARVLPRKDLLDVIETLHRVADVILVDHPVGLPDLFLEVVERSGPIFTVTNGSLPAFKSLRDLIHVLQEIGTPAGRIFPLLTGLGSSANTEKEFNRVLQGLETKITKVFPDERTVAEEALVVGQPIGVFAPHSRFSQATRELLSDILGKNLARRAVDPSEADHAPRRSGFFQRIFDSF